MNKLNDQIEKLENELAELKRIANKSSLIKLSEQAKDINGNILKLNFEDAKKYAELIGSRLPTKDEIQALIDNKVDIRNTSFWSALVHPNSPNRAYFFGYDSGTILYDHQSYKLAVMCVVPIR